MCFSHVPRPSTTYFATRLPIALEWSGIGLIVYEFHDVHVGYVSSRFPGCVVFGVGEGVPVNERIIRIY